ncbi:MAG: chemotaxis protein, partial [Bacteroidetes bacterium HGW-Bacteroidetes-12]
GSRQMSISKRALDTVELFTQIEIYVLVFLAIVIQIIVMYKPKEKS